MIWIARTALVVLWLCVAGELCALTVEYGNLFKVSDVQHKNGRPVLPLTREQYDNIRVLDKETFEFLKHCRQNCTQPSGEGSVQVREVRPAKTRDGMWIADVSIDGKWLITFLVFRHAAAYEVKQPEHFDFLDIVLKGRVEKLIVDSIKKNNSTAKQENS